MKVGELINALSHWDYSFNVKTDDGSDIVTTIGSCDQTINQREGIMLMLIPGNNVRHDA